MRFHGFLAVLVAVVVAAGCVGDGGTASERSSTPASDVHEPGALLADGAGAIAGTVVNEETAPVVGALVGLDATQTTTTDEAGRFSFKAVPPGSHELQIQALGYASIGRAVDVIEGEVTQLI